MGNTVNYKGHKLWQVGISWYDITGQDAEIDPGGRPGYPKARRVGGSLAEAKRTITESARTATATH